MDNQSISITSDSEDEYIKSRIGKVPFEWYKKEEHLGYTDKGKHVGKLESQTQLDKLLQLEDNKNFWRTIEDQLNNKVHVLTKEQIALIQKIRKKGYISDYIKNKDYTIEPEINIHPMYNGPVSKKRFLPSENERKKINKIVHAIKMGWMKPYVPKQKKNEVEEFLNNVQDVWNYQEGKQNYLPRIPPPKIDLPHHDQSFNPTPEYFDEQIQPKTNLRTLEASQDLIKERFERLMSLYLAPRIKRKKIEMKEEDLLEKLPDLNDFKPFPVKKIFDLKTDLGLIVSLSMYKNDHYFAIADEFDYVQIYHTLTTRKIIEFRMQTENLVSIKFLNSGILMVICEEYISFYNVKLNLKQFEENKKNYEQLYEVQQKLKNDDQEISYSFPYFEQEKTKREYVQEIMKINLKKNTINSGDLHKKEEFLVLVTKRQDDSRQIDVINIKKCTHSKIKIKAKSQIQNCIFHNKKPYILIMTLSNIFIFDLQTQGMKKKLVSQCKRLSHIQVHNSGDHVLAGSYDKKLLWFDLDSGQYPYKKVEIHEKAVRKVKFCNKFKLFASCSDEGKIIIQHAEIDEEGFSYPKIIPLKILKSHSKNKLGFSVFDIEFFDQKYWMVSAGTNGLVNFFA